MVNDSRQENPVYVWHYDYYLSANAPDAFTAFDPERIASEIASTGATFAVVFALNQHGYAYYPSRIAPVHPMLGDRDYTGSMIEALQRRGLTVLTYVNYMNIDRREAHPEWWQRAADGTQVLENGWGVPCPNGPIREYMCAVVGEVAAKYPTQGFFFDMFSFNRGGCWCDNCRRKFAVETGLPFPIRADWGSESWRHYIAFRYRSALETIQAIRDAAKAVRSDLIWVTHCSPESNWIHGTGALPPAVDDMLQSEMATRWGKGRWSAAQRSKVLRAVTRGQQVVTILADLHLYWDKPKGWFYIPWSVEHVKRQVAEIVAHGAWPSIYTEPYPDGRNDPHTIQGIREAFSMARATEAYRAGAEPVKSVALHYSRPSLDFFGRDDPVEYAHSFEGAYKALLESRIPFDVILDEGILDGRIRAYDLAILSNSACTSDQVNAALLDYVQGGGSLLATYRTSLCDEYGRQRPDFGLGQLFGARFVREFERAYMRAEAPLAQGLSVSPLIQQRLLQVTAEEGAGVLGRLIAPSPTDLSPFTYVSAPTVETAWPALLRRGQVIYAAGDLGYALMRAGTRDHLRLLGNCVRELLGDRLPLELKGPGTVDVSLWRSKIPFRGQGQRLVVHLVNLVTNQIVEDTGCEADAYETIPLHGLELRVRTEWQPRKVFRAGDDGDGVASELAWRRDGDWVAVELPRLDLYEVVVLEP